MAVSPRRGPQRGPQQTRRRLIKNATVDGTDNTLLVWQPLSEPVRRKWNPAWTIDAGIQPVVPPPLISAFSSYNTIVPFAKSFLYPSIQEPPAIAPLVYAFSTTNAVVTYAKSLLYPSIQEPTPLTITTTVTFGWLSPLSEPTRRKVSAASQPNFPFVGSDTATDNRWFTPFGEPTKRRGNRAEQQQAYTAPQIPTVTFGYYAPFSEPQRQKKGISYTLQPTTFAPYNPTVTFAYYNWLSEPQRQKKGISHVLQLTTAAPYNPPTPSFGYYNRFAEPQRLSKNWLLTAQQSSLIWSPFAPITAQIQASFFSTIVPYARSLLYPSLHEPPVTLGKVTGIINAFQLNTDTAEISVFVKNYDIATHALVSIEEILDGWNVADPHYLTSIQEIAPDGGSQTSVSESSPDGHSNTSIEEDEP